MHSRCRSWVKTATSLDVRVTAALPPEADIRLRCKICRDGPCVDGSELARVFFTSAVLVGAAMMGWTAPHSHVTGWWDINSRQQRGGGYCYQGDWA